MQTAGVAEAQRCIVNDPIVRIAEALERIAIAMEQQALPQPEALDKEGAARFIGVDVGTIEQLIRTRRLAYVQHGSQRGRVIPVESLRAFLRQNLMEVMGINGHS